ncbi:MAG: phosphate/phosphite/phosphonate ABC transporter substrate-binding protein [Candidatus Electrothrix sp. AR3]|nr:phosphate/phosphite/phosphonate ABC transporter substrate-binding protein [Candidatus Electrothrix sp. AR3]
MQRKPFTVVIIALFLWICTAQAEEAVILGVLAQDGRSNTIKQWSATGEYLAAHLDRPVEIIPLAFKKFLPAVKNNQVDFFITDPSMFLSAKIMYSAVPVVHMTTLGGNRFGGVIFTAANKKKITELQNLQGKKFGAVERASFSGWQMAQKEFADSTIDAHRFFSTLRFFGTHSSVVKAVLNRQVDAGTVKTGILEKMAERGEIKITDFKILAQKEYTDFPFLVSTALYPEWVLARTAATDISLANKAATALKYLTEGAKAAMDAQYIGWTEPQEDDFSFVEELQKELKIGSYKKINNILY